MPRAILVQHHALARLPLPLAPMRPTTLRPLHQAGPMQLRPRPAAATVEVVIAAPVPMAVQSAPAAIHRALKLQHPAELSLDNALGRGPAHAALGEAGY